MYTVRFMTIGYYSSPGASRSTADNETLGVLFVIFGATMSIRNYQKAKDYRTAHRRYHAQRTQIIDEER